MQQNRQTEWHEQLSLLELVLELPPEIVQEIVRVNRAFNKTITQCFVFTMPLILKAVAKRSFLVG